MTVTRITPQETADRLSAEADLTYVDVRSVREFTGGHPAGAVNVPLADHNDFGQMAPNPVFMDAVEALFPDKGAKLVLGCAAGGRSLRAAQMLAAAGYTHVVDMRGGFSGKRMPPVEPGWTDAGLPVANDGKTWATIRSQIG